MIDETDGRLLAVAEYLEACVSTETRRVAAMPQAHQDFLGAMVAAHESLPKLPGVGEAIAIRRA